MSTLLTNFKMLADDAEDPEDIEKWYRNLLNPNIYYEAQSFVGIYKEMQEKADLIKSLVTYLTRDECKGLYQQKPCRTNNMWVIESVQKRSADEGETTYLKCERCGYTQIVTGRLR